MAVSLQLASLDEADAEETGADHQTTLADIQRTDRRVRPAHENEGAADLMSDGGPSPKNLHRRHLDESQRAMVTSKIANLKKGGDRRSENFKGPIGTLKGEQPSVSLKQAAKMMNVSERSAKRAQEYQLAAVQLSI